MSESNTQRVDSIDGMRGLLVLYVMLGHFSIFIGDHFYFAPIKNLAGQGHLAVPFFFALSGLLLYRQMSLRGEGSDLGASFRFYVRRFFRIYPIWALAVLFYWASFGMSAEVVLSNLTFTFGFLMFDSKYLPIAPAWSLFVEEVFYLLFPLVLLVSKTTKQAVISFIATLLIGYLWIRYAAELGVPTSNSFVGWFPLGSFHFFFLGIVVFHFAGSFMWERFSATRKAGWVLNGASLACIASFFTQTAITYLIPSVFVLLLGLFCDGSLFSRVLRTPLLRFIGIRCYPLYLVHDLLIHSLSNWKTARSFAFSLVPYFTEVRLLLTFPIFVIACLIVSELLHAWVERPAISFGSRLLIRAPFSQSAAGRLSMRSSITEVLFKSGR